MGKKDLRIFLLVRADARASVPSLPSLVPLLPEAPVHWSLPSCLFAGPDAEAWHSLVAELFELRPLDMVVSPGYAGAPHPMLQIEELRREVEWGLHVPGDGEHRYRPLPGVLAPAAADLLRPEALRLYASKGLRRLVVAATADWSAGSELASEGGGLQVLYHHAVAEVEAQRAGRLVGRVAGGLLGIACAPAEAHRLRSLLGRLAAHASMDTFRLDQPLALAQPGRPAPQPGSDAALRDRASSVSAFRTHRQGTDETASVLQVLAGARTVAGPERSVDVFPAPRRENTAVMMGAVSLSEGALGAHFDAGRLAGLSWNGRPVTPAAPSRSYAGPTARPRPYEVAASFALEAERLRGLRSLHRLAGDSALLTLEYFFVEDFGFLLVTGRVRAPARRGPLTVAPFEMPVARLGPAGEATVHVVCRGEAPYRVAVPSGPTPFCVSGGLFWFDDPDGGLVAGFPPVKEPAIESVWLRRERAGAEILLVASFFASREVPGSDRSEAVAGSEELFSLYLGVAFEAPRVLPVFPRAVLDEIPYHAVGR